MSNRRRPTTSLDDQAEAAIAEARVVFDRLQQVSGAGIAPGALLGGWLREIANEVVEEVTGRSVDYCIHVRGGPRVLHVGAWNRRLIVCSSCVAMLRVAGAEDRRCDHCSRVGESVWSSTNWFGGALFLHFGLCDDCAVELGAPTRAAGST